MKKSTSLLIIGSLFLLVFAIGVLVQPVLFHGVNLTRSGQIGDMIGGIAAPVVGIMGAVLVYLSFRTQVEANSIQTKALNKQMQIMNAQMIKSDQSREYELFLRQFEFLQNACRDFEYSGLKGFAGLSKFSDDISSGSKNIKASLDNRFLVQITYQLSTLTQVVRKGHFSESGLRHIKGVIVFFYFNWLEDIIQKMIEFSEDKPTNESEFAKNINTFFEEFVSNSAPEDFGFKEA